MAWALAQACLAPRAATFPETATQYAMFDLIFALVLVLTRDWDCLGAHGPHVRHSRAQRRVDYT